MEHLYTFIETYKYLALFIVAVLEGPMVAVFAGFLVITKEFSLLPTYIILVLGNVLPDLTYYLIGYFGHRNSHIKKLIHHFAFIHEHYQLVTKLWNTHFRKTVFFSKLAYGLSTPFLISAGLVRIPLFKFISHTIVIDLVVIAILVALGSFLGQAYTVVSGYLFYFGLLMAVAFVLFLIGFRYLSKRAAEKLITLEE